MIRGTTNVRAKAMKRTLTLTVAGLLGVFAAPPTLPWPGGPARTADRDGLGGNVSGLAYANESTVWAVRDGPGALVKLERNGSDWIAAPGWDEGRNLEYADGSGEPDAEGVTVDADGVIYVAAERDNKKGGTSRNTVLRYDISGSGTLRATRQWEFNAILPQAAANTGIEAIAWVPDDALVAAGFRDLAGAVYRPADYPGHGKGLFVVAPETNGTLYTAALRNDGGVALISTMPSGLSAVMDLTWSPARQELWAVCDNTCGGAAAVFRLANGGFEPTAVVQPPDGMANLNNEGFAVAPTCSSGSLAVLWSDDGATGGKALRAATLPCAGFAAATPTPTTTAAPITTRAGEAQPRAAEGGSSATGLLIAVAVLALGAIGSTVAIRRKRAR